MKLVLNKKKKSEPSFIVLNENAQAYTGLIGGYPQFEDDWGKAKPLQHIEQIKYLNYGTKYKLEIHFT